MGEAKGGGALYREINIRPVINGFVVKVGCTEIVFTDANEMEAAFVEYMSDPRKAQEQWLSKANSHQIGYANEQIPPIPIEEQRRQK
jgi:hypothetical protein